jgi:hypothetical protein
VAGNRGSKQISAIHVNSPEFSKSINWVLDGLEIFSKASRGDQVVYFAMLLDNLSYAGLDRVGIRYIGVMCRHFGNARKEQPGVLETR